MWFIGPTSILGIAIVAAAVVACGDGEARPGDASSPAARLSPEPRVPEARATSTVEATSTCSPTISDGLPCGVVFETPTITAASHVFGTADQYRRAAEPAIAAVIDAVEAGEYERLTGYFAWNELTCAPAGHRAIPNCSQLGLPPDTPIRTFFTGFQYHMFETSVAERFAVYLAAEPRLIAAAQSIDDQGLTFLEFGIDPRLTYVDEVTPTIFSFVLVLDPAANAPVQTFLGRWLIEFVREQQQHGAFPVEMTLITPDARWRVDSMDAAVDACRTAHSGCVSSVDWPNDTWPSRN